MNTTARIRFVTPADAPALAAIYAPYVLETVISFEYDPPPPEEFVRRIIAISATHPYLVCDIGGTPVGYAYACPHQDRAAYRFDVEVSAYVSRDAHSRRIGSSLYGALFELLARLGYYNAFAGITQPNKKSMALHRSAGFSEIGTYHRTGYKFGEWHDVLWLEKRIQPHSKNPEPPRSIQELSAHETDALFAAHAARIPDL